MLHLKVTQMSIEKIRKVLLNLPESNKLYVGDFPDFGEHKIGKSPESKFITLLLKANNSNNRTFVPGGGKYLSIQFDVLCSIFDDQNIQSNTNFTILTLKSNEKDLEDYFLELCLILIQRLGLNPQIEDVKCEIEKLESIFLKLSKSSKSSVIGIWGELFIIESSKNPEKLIAAWHKAPSDLFDFNDGTNKIEVKTTIQKNRIHSFEISQLQSIPNVSIVIASVMTCETDLGKSIFDLLLSIKGKVNINSYEGLLAKTFDVLGDKFDESFETKFDYSMAKGKTKYFESDNIPRPLKIPIEVSNVKFYVDIEGVKYISNFNSKNDLFKSLGHITN